MLPDPAPSLDTRFDHVMVSVTTRGATTDLDGIAVGIDAGLGECPVWDVASSTLGCLDIAHSQMSLIDPDRMNADKFDLPVRATALLADDDQILLVAGQQLHWFDRGTGRTELAADLAPLLPNDAVFNDAKTDRAGRIWIGSRHVDRLPGMGGLHRIDSSSNVFNVSDEFTMTNGIAWSSSGEVMYVADSRKRVIFSYRYDLSTGQPADRAVFADFSRHEGAPDGLTVDRDDHIWCAVWDGGSVLRFDPSGVVDTVVDLPVKRPTSCMFGGQGLTTLFITTAALDDGSELGSVYGIHVGTQGILEHRPTMERQL